MVVAWTALFHAIFAKRKVKPYYRQKKNPQRFERVDGDFKCWELWARLPANIGLTSPAIIISTV